MDSNYMWGRRAKGCKRCSSISVSFLKKKKIRSKPKKEMKKENILSSLNTLNVKRKEKIYIAAWKKRKHNGNVYIYFFEIPGDERIFVWWNDLFLDVFLYWQWKNMKKQDIRIQKRNEWKMLCVRVRLREKWNAL